MKEITIISTLSSLLVVLFGVLAYFCKRMIDQIDKSFEIATGRFDQIDSSLTEIRKDMAKQDTTIAVLNEKIDSIEEHCPMLGKTS